MPVTSGIIKVDFPTLDQAIGNTRQTASFMENQLGNLQTDLGQLRQMWDGPAAGSYKVLQDKWNQAYTDLNTILTRISKELQEIRDYYWGQGQNKANRWGQGSGAAAP